jgi:predicted amidohydrolase YtcJ
MALNRCGTGAHRTIHTYTVDRADMPRFAALGIIADMQVGEGSIDLLYHGDLYEITGERAYGLLPVSELLKAGARVSLSSDWDADPISVLGIIQRSMLRESHALADIETAIRLVTRDAALALDLSEVTVTLVTGLQADFVVLDQNVLDLPLSDIEHTSVLMTVLAGKPVFKSLDY